MDSINRLSAALSFETQNVNVMKIEELCKFSIKCEAAIFVDFLSKDDKTLKYTIRVYGEWNEKRYSLLNHIIIY